MIYIQSNIGGRTVNQDFYGFAQTKFGELIIVCDGMGGHNAGRYAAERAVQIIIQEVTKSDITNPSIALQQAILKANDSIWQESNTDISLKGMGSTVVALLITPEKAVCGHLGDSRAYQLRKQKVLHRTYDHSLVFDLLREGRITEEQARLSDKSNIITRSLGTKPMVNVEITDNLSYQAGDRFFLCSDGVYGIIPENQLIELIAEKTELEVIITNLIDSINTIGIANGGNHDNLTAALIEMEKSSK
ncbi:MAG: protein phosphatase 2C domain-containing protein [Bacteroidales bacterium]